LASIGARRAPLPPRGFLSLCGVSGMQSSGGGVGVKQRRWSKAIDGHLARSTTARPKARGFGPAQARHSPLATVLGLARPASRARAWAATPAHRAARPDTK
jgi:hypothetical protein